MSPGLKRTFDYFSYTVTGLVVVAGAYYGIQRLSPPPIQLAPLPPDPVATPVAAAPPAAVPPAPAAPPPLPAPAPATAANSDENLAAATANTVSAQDKATFFALQKNCYDAAANNQDGEYPALQASACDRYAQFANQRGWNTGPLPAYGQAAPQAAAPVQQMDAAVMQTSAQPQVIILDQNFDRSRPLHGHRHDQAAGATPQQIGPNYALPAPQQPPPVSQEQPRVQRSAPVHAARPPG